MLTLADALSQTVPPTDPWATQALTSIGLDDVPTQPVLAVSLGWMRQAIDGGVADVPILFVLLEDRVAFGQAGVARGAAYGAPLASIVALEAVDEPDSALDTVEVHLGDGIVVVGWAPDFCQAVVAALSSQERPAAASADDPTMPAELGGAAVANDPSSLDALAPSGWTEPPVAPVAAVSPETAVAPATPPPPPAWAVAGTGPETAVAPPAPTEAPAAVPASVPEVAPAPPPGPEPVATVPVTTSEDAVDPAAPPTPEEARPPWLNPSMVWPDPLRGVAYIGGHPDHARRRKNGTLVFTPRGWTAAGGGMSNWMIAVGWDEVEHVSIQNAEELEFVEGFKIDPSSSALCVQLVDGSQVILEVRMRRPPSLRATLAPVLLMVESIPAWRAGSSR